MGQRAESLSLHYFLPAIESFVSESWWQHPGILSWLHSPLAVVGSCWTFDVKKLIYSADHIIYCWISCLGWDESLSPCSCFSSWTVKWAWSDELRDGYLPGATWPWFCFSWMTVAVMVTGPLDSHAELWKQKICCLGRENFYPDGVNCVLALIT